MATLPPQISRYTIKSLIGRGGMGDLYLAHDPNTNRLVAIKLLNATLDSTELRERFAREARALAALNHPNIVNIYDTGEFDDSPFIVMEYVRGETLAEMIKRRAELSVAQKLRLMEELCAGLAQAHEAGIIHRDIKPANLMVDQQGRLKILDFGIARVAEDNRTRLGLPLTQVNMMIGTPGYMSPEQIEGGAVDHRSDIFAVGAVCYELFSYGEAFGGTNTRQIESRVLQAQPVPLASVVPGLDPEIDAIVFRALKRDPNKRYQDAATFEKALERLRSRLGSDGGKVTVARPTPSQGAGGKVRDMRADAAYQRALDRFQGNAPDAARRFAIEALAENPSHAGARALLARLDRRPAAAATQLAEPQPGSATAVSTSAGDFTDGTLVNRTVAGTSSAKTSATFASAPTIILPPKPAKAPVAQNRAQRVWGKDQPLRKAYEKLWKRDPTSAKRHEPVWMRYRWPALAILVLLIAGVMIAAIRWGSGFATSDPLLTITRPDGGTISAVGITCGTLGTNCSVNRPKGDAVELTPQADAGFTFAGYTGDCAPAGRTIMSSSRTCGATFTKAAETAPAIGATQALTIAPVPKGGTLEGVDIICGTKGSICSVNHPDGVPVELHPTADPGYTFMGFLGDCVPLGHTQMTGPRTCSATFSPTAEVSAPPVLKPSQSGAVRGNRNAGGTVPALPGSEAPSSSPPSSNPSAANPSSPNQSAALAPVRRGAPPTIVVDPTAGGQKPVAPPPTDEEFAKMKIQEMLKDYCDAHEALDPAAVQRVFPKVNMDALRVQLNKSKYRSVQCKISEVMFVSIDAPGGNAKVTALRKLVYEHTIQNEPLTDELAATFTLVRLGPRAQWQIETAQFRKAEKK